MSSITSLLNSIYSFTSGSGNSSNGTNSITSLTDAVDAISESASASSNSQDAYALNLSASAQNYLNGTNTSYVLSSDQQKTISNIIATYKDAPFNQETFEKIQQDLEDAGVGTKQLALMDKIKTFNPTSILLQAMNGDASSSDPLQTSGNDTDQAKAKENDFLQSIVTSWQKISTTYTDGQTEF